MCATATGAAVVTKLSALAEAAGNKAFCRAEAPAAKRAIIFFLLIDFCFRGSVGSERATLETSESSGNLDEDDKGDNTNLDNIGLFAEAVGSECFGFVDGTTAFGNSGLTAEDNELKLSTEARRRAGDTCFTSCLSAATAAARQRCPEESCAGKVLDLGRKLGNKELTFAAGNDNDGDFFCGRLPWK